MRVGLFGGTFDPVHVGHVAPVRAARRQLGLDRVHYLPTAVPPHKPDARPARASARFVMLELALLGEEELLVSDHELVLDRPSYTVHTLEHFRRELPGSELVLLVGSDSFVELPSWRRWRDILELAKIAVLDRPGTDRDEMEAGLPPALVAALDDGNATFLHTPRHDVSASALRNRLAAGEEPAADAMDATVVEYIRKYDLYDEGSRSDASA